MLASLVARLVKPFRRRAAAACSSRQARFARLELEALEDRQMLSANWSVLPLPGGTPVMVAEEAAVQAAPKGNPSIVFLGDSITYGLSHYYGAPVWQQYLAPWNSLDLAVAGQSTSNILYQVNNGVLNGTSPAVIVLMIGTNNLFWGQTPQQTAEGIVADVQAIHAAEPGSQILVLGVPPNAYTDYGTIRQTNTLAAIYLGYQPFASQINYADVGQIFLGPDGTILPGVLVDGVHPSTLGYQLEVYALTEPLYYSLIGWYLNLLAKEQNSGQLSA